MEHIDSLALSTLDIEVNSPFSGDSDIKHCDNC